MNPFNGIYADRRVLLTGHTGFKGSWLAAWLTRLGAKVTGLSLDPDSACNHWDLLDVGVTDLRVDIRDSAAVQRAFRDAQPEIVFHLAAQTLVRSSYADPLHSWSTNVMGTANVLEACRLTPGILAAVVVTTDKVYSNREWPWGYRENDALAGHDPYSASKAASELLVDSYRKAYWLADDAVLVASARAGNVIGGGDWARDRLVPDLVRAVQSRQPLRVRSPHAVRPWQHVLDSLSGYLLLGQRLLQREPEFACAWNFGPAADDACTVTDLLNALQAHWPAMCWVPEATENPLHEAGMLQLDCAQARSLLSWRPVLALSQALEMTAKWYRHHDEHGQVLTTEQLEQYFEAAKAQGCCWLLS